MNTTSKQTPVCITRCNHCGLEQTSFREISTPCPRCDCEVQIARWIADPCPETVALAERAEAELLAEAKRKFAPGTEVKFRANGVEKEGRVENISGECASVREKDGNSLWSPRLSELLAVE